MMEYIVEIDIDMNEMHKIYKEVQQAAYEIIKRKSNLLWYRSIFKSFNYSNFK